MKKLLVFLCALSALTLFANSSANSNSCPQFSPEHKSLMVKHLSPKVCAQLSGKKSASGFTLEQVIAAGTKGKHYIIGATAGDESSYTTFAPLLDKIIESYHGFKPSDSHKTDLDINHLRGGKLDNEFVISTRIRSARNVAGYGLPPHMTKASRLDLESNLKEALNSLSGELAVRYYGLEGMNEATRLKLIDDHFLFVKPKPGSLLNNSGADAHWPSARGIYHNNDKTFLVWVNEEDHMRVIAMEKGGDVRGVFARWLNGVNGVEKALQTRDKKFMHNSHLGYIATCPSNLGTGLRAGVHIKIPLLSKHKDFNSIMDQLRLQPRGINGEHTESVGGVYDLSNKARIGYTEVELVQTLIDGVEKVIELEKVLQKKKSIAALI